MKSRNLKILLAAILTMSGLNAGANDSTGPTNLPEVINHYGIDYAVNDSVNAVGDTTKTATGYLNQAASVTLDRGMWLVTQPIRLTGKALGSDNVKTTLSQ